MVHPTPLHRHPGFHVRLGFVPLLDSAPLIVARELGLFDAEGLDVELVREGSWASLRDKVTFGLIDGGHMLAPMPLSMSLAIDRPKVPVVVGMVLSRNGNGITLGNRLFGELQRSATNLDNPIATARELISLARHRGEPIRLASVAPWSSHDLQLRDWLASAGPDAEHHIQIIPVSPIQMVDAFRSNAIEGCCVGEPWNSLLEYENLGRILHSGHQIWQNAPEKVLGMRADWMSQHGVMYRHLVRALLAGCRWLDNRHNHRLLREILAKPEYLGEQINVLDDHPYSLFHPRLEQHFFRHSANFPWLSQAHWLASRLTLRGQLGPVSGAMVRQVIRPDLFRDAAASMGIDTPVIDSKMEGRHQLPFTLSGRYGPVAVASDRLLGERLHDWRADNQDHTSPPNNEALRTKTATRTGPEQGN
ncbi:CmpA/NrtA family ABC transporter substrate-binding protein [Marinobacter sp. SS13-12]|uniref:CmpA/NrtA family ABC transporter substrate-binding protein n=1 Tax=Marinobacter sp. SS13-12 TaxID=3050451 RepID=UPI002552A4D8|nr:CmpA/NrtA family ABC transporter substrate-binding protein [Marinobacter sp. SS13-12]MDK8462270.1 CmpA/NrtA family ABC transporter substrate-binding protein [Marinobacter sp. SS13-12]